jgi:hypothetical protein
MLTFTTQPHIHKGKTISNCDSHHNLCDARFIRLENYCCGNGTECCVNELLLLNLSDITSAWKIAVRERERAFCACAELTFQLLYLGDYRRNHKGINHSQMRQRHHFRSVILRAEINGAHNYVYNGREVNSMQI